MPPEQTLKPNSREAEIAADSGYVITGATPHACVICPYLGRRDDHAPQPDQRNQRPIDQPETGRNEQRNERISRLRIDTTQRTVKQGIENPGYGTLTVHVDIFFYFLSTPLPTHIFRKPISLAYHPLQWGVSSTPWILHYHACRDRILGPGDPQTLLAADREKTNLFSNHGRLATRRKNNPAVP